MFLNFCLVSDKGRTSKGQGLLYDMNNFASHKDRDIVVDRLGDGCRVEFPVHLRQVVKETYLVFVF